MSLLYYMEDVPYLIMLSKGAFTSIPTALSFLVLTTSLLLIFSGHKGVTSFMGISQLVDCGWILYSSKKMNCIAIQTQVTTQLAHHTELGIEIPFFAFEGRPK